MCVCVCVCVCVCRLSFAPSSKLVSRESPEFQTMCMYVIVTLRYELYVLYIRTYICGTLCYVPYIVHTYIRISPHCMHIVSSHIVHVLLIASLFLV